MKKILTFALAFTLVMGGVRADDNFDIQIQLLDNEIAQLTAEKQRQFPALDRCARQTRNFRIAGISLIGVTVAGFAYWNWFQRPELSSATACETDRRNATTLMVQEAERLNLSTTGSENWFWCARLENRRYQSRLTVSGLAVKETIDARIEIEREERGEGDIGTPTNLTELRTAVQTVGERFAQLNSDFETMRNNWQEAGAQDAELDQGMEELAGRIQQIQNQLTALQNAVSGEVTPEQLAALQRQLAELQTAIRDANTQLAALRRKLTALTSPGTEEPAARVVSANPAVDCAGTWNPGDQDWYDCVRGEDGRYSKVIKQGFVCRGGSHNCNTVACLNNQRRGRQACAPVRTGIATAERFCQTDGRAWHTQCYAVSCQDGWNLVEGQPTGNFTCVQQNDDVDNSAAPTSEAIAEIEQEITAMSEATTREEVKARMESLSNLQNALPEGGEATRLRNQRFEVMRVQGERFDPPVVTALETAIAAIRDFQPTQGQDAAAGLAALVDAARIEADNLIDVDTWVRLAVAYDAARDSTRTRLGIE
jgi:hypothetical protein